MSITISHGDKGGVGKSLVICAYADYLSNKPGFQRDKLVILDADPRNADVFRMFDGYLRAERISLASKEDWMRLVDRFQDEQPQGLDYVISLPAGIGAILAQEGKKFGDYVGALGHDITMYWTIDRMPDSVNLLKRALFDLSGKVKQTILVKNQFFGAAESFTRWDKSNLRKLFLHQGGIEAAFPELHEWVIDEVIGNQLDENDVKDVLVKLGALSETEATAKPAHRTVPFSELLKRNDLRITLRGEMDEWLRKVDAFFTQIESQTNNRNISKKHKKD